MIYTHLIAAAVAALAAWFFQDNRYTAELAELRLEASEDKRKAVTTARNDERAITKTYQGALNAARTRETLLRTEIDHLRLVSDGLRTPRIDCQFRGGIGRPISDIGGRAAGRSTAASVAVGQST